MKYLLIPLLLVTALTIPANAGFGGVVTIVAAGTTIAVNGRTLLSSLRHPKIAGKKAAKVIKESVKNKVN